MQNSPNPPRRLVRRKRAAETLDTSITMLKRLEREGRLTVVRLGARDVFYPAEQIDALARGEGT
jgi:predicted site-specific integrase-resolvase